ncbi:hypothetical protein FRC08_007089 [Ceratobasidium sp. 394]|nr:hypothetical protein FRC08_007089 [Ceratobasidium sp. 394]KAG9078324.1 hypothetical protein FS749_009691 [Ceratobasidium sp. UAMH 11750]
MSRKRSNTDDEAPVHTYDMNEPIHAPQTDSSASRLPAPGQGFAPSTSQPTKKRQLDAAQPALASPRHPQLTERSTKLDKTKYILEYFGQHDKYKLGDFLETLFDPDTLEHLENNQKTALTRWLTGGTRKGTRPAEIVDAIYRHPSGIHREDNVLARADFSDLAPPPHPPSFAGRHPQQVSLLPPGEALDKTQVNSRQGLEQLMVRGTLNLVDQEAHRLADANLGLPRGAGITWSDIDSLSRSDYETSIRNLAPVIWGIFSTIVFNRDTSKKAAESASSTDNLGDVLPGMMMAILMLIALRNSFVNFFQTVLAVFLFACSTHKLVYRALNRIGLSKSHSSLHEHLKQLAQSAIASLKVWGLRAYESACSAKEGPNQYFLLVFDNINKLLVARRQTVGTKNQMRSGTAATAIALEDVPPGAFDPQPYWDCRNSQKRKSLSTQELLDDIDPDHLEALGIGMVMRILIRYVPGLSGDLRQEVESRFKDPDYYAKHRLRLRKSTTMTMGTSSIDESTVGGVSEILEDLVSTQMEMKPSWFEKLLVIICGDQLTIDRLRKVIRYKATETSVYESRRWAVPLIQLWHMKVAYLGSIFKVHWFPKVNSDLFGLRQSVQALQRNLNPEKCDFYVWHDAVKTTFESMVLTSAYVILQEESHGPIIDTNHMTDELAKHFAKGGRYHECTLQQLEHVAKQVYRRFMTTEAYHMTLGAPNQPADKQSLEDSILKELHRYDQDPNYSTGNMGSGHSADQLLGNVILFMRDTFWYLEFASAVPEGDIGRVHEIIKLLRFSFWGSGSSNYGSELLELACGFLYEYSDKLKTAIFNNYLVNPSGLAGHWQECDFFQEHCNKAIKTIFNTKNSEWDSKFMRDAVSINIGGLTRLRDSMIEFLGLKRTARGHARRDYTTDINVLASHYLPGRVFQLNPGRLQDCVAFDMFEEGHNKLESGALSRFLARTTLNRAGEAGPVVDPEEEEPPQDVEIPHQPLVMEDGSLTREDVSDDED